MQLTPEMKKIFSCFLVVLTLALLLRLIFYLLLLCSLFYPFSFSLVFLFFFSFFCSPFSSLVYRSLRLLPILCLTSQIRFHLVVLRLLHLLFFFLTLFFLLFRLSLRLLFLLILLRSFRLLFLLSLLLLLHLHPLRHHHHHHHHHHLLPNRLRISLFPQLRCLHRLLHHQIVMLFELPRLLFQFRQKNFNVPDHNFDPWFLTAVISRWRE